LINLLLATLAIYYIATTITEYDGPFEVLKRLREIMREYRGLNLDCFFCTSLWVSLPFALYFTSGWSVLLYWLGLAGAANVLNEVLSNE